jgi:2-phospho-L-lactate guanylyltransferase
VGNQADRVIIIHGDLPLVTSQDLELLAAAPEGEIAIAPDRHGTGTNAISLPLPAAKGFSFAFGPDSFALHNAEAGRLGLKIEEIHSPGLSRDVDEPDDLPDAADLMGPI